MNECHISDIEGDLLSHNGITNIYQIKVDGKGVVIGYSALWMWRNRGPEPACSQTTAITISIAHHHVVHATQTSLFVLILLGTLLFVCKGSRQSFVEELKPLECSPVIDPL
ncbi:hypothetical protein C8J56DRAFT_883304 [Mycena floridula]|nr:hypothetical protein C8J56DRAFT_883304 [Mycena floridula]